MKKFTLKKHSIFYRIVMPMLIVMLLQSVIFCGSIFMGGTLEKLEQSEYELLNESVSNRMEYIHGYMVERWSNVGESVKSVNRKVDATSKANSSKKIDELGNEIFSEISDDVLQIMTRNFVSGAFVVLLGDSVENYHPNQSVYSLYLRDNNPNSAALNYSDLSIARAPYTVTQQLQALGLTTSSNYDTMATIPDIMSSDYYYMSRPYLAAQKTYGEYDYFGYWSSLSEKNEEELELLTYTVPLMLENRQPYGILGIEVDKQYLRLLLPASELADSNMGAYVMGVSCDSDKSDFDVVAKNGVAYDIYVKDSLTISFEKESQHNNDFYVSNLKDKNKKAIACVSDLHVYNTGTPFVSDRWSIIGLVDSKVILGSRNDMLYSMVWAVLLSAVVVLISTFCVSYWLSSPISKLISKIKSPQNSEGGLPPTRIYEIDELTNAISELHKDVRESAEKLTNIIDMAGVKIGAYEFDRQRGKLFVTDQVFNILHRKEAISELSVEKFDDILEENEQYFDFSEKSNSNVYHYVEGEKDYWTRIKTLDKGAKLTGVCEDITREMREKKKLERERDYDVLTNLLNRRAFQNIATNLFDSNVAIGYGAMVMMDLDNLKYINDTYGHDLGDEYIKGAAKILDSFSDEHTIVARMSGDEFYVFFYHYDTKGEIIDIIDKIKDAFSESKMTLPDDTIIKIRTSAGVSWYPDDTRIFDELIRFADFAMYEIKHWKKGEFNNFDKESYRNGSYVLRNKEALNKLIDENLVTYHFQPIVEVATGEIYGYEALMRSLSPAFNSPKEILTVASSQSKLNLIERLTWRNALKVYAEKFATEKDKRIFINTIPNQDLTESFLVQFEKDYSEYLHNIVIEITENEKQNLEFTKKKIDYANKWNCKIALDDFGTGYNTDTVLLELDPYYVKCDISILHNIDGDEKRQKLFTKLASYCKDRNIKIIAEGVETKAEMKKVIELGCDFIQGFYLAQPSEHPVTLSSEVRQEILTFYHDKSSKKS